MPDINDLGPRGLAWKRVSPDYIKVRLNNTRLVGTVNTRRC